ncbi:MAG: Gx transporter family protein [Spirochaetales bacterium]|nr:Gx transporter family protein [Spirochaetales bacterium]
MKLSSDSRLRLIAKLGALALFLSTLEYLIPKPVPFMRLGLANVPVMLSLALLKPSGYALLVLLKIVGQALVTGTLFSYVFLFSLGGSVAAAVVMFVLYRLLGRQVSFLGISMAGALASNGVQLLLAGALLFGPSVRLLAPPFLIMGLVSSILLGLFTRRFAQASSWFRDAAGDSCREGATPPIAGSEERPKTDLRLITGLAVLPAFLLQPSLAGTFILAGAALGAAVSAGRKIRLLPILLVLLSVVFANLLQANGLVLFSLGSFSVTAGALQIGIKKACTLIGMIYLSQFMVSTRPRLPGFFGRLVSLQLYYFEGITEKWRGLKDGGLLSRLDALLYRLDEEPAGARSDAVTRASRQTTAGRGLMVSYAVLAWGLLIPGFLGMIP